MNSRHWKKTVIKLLNRTNSVYNFSNNGSETENSGIKPSTLARKHARHVSTQDTLAREHVGTQGILARKHVRHDGKWARNSRWYVSTQGTLAREHVFSTHCTQFSRLVNGRERVVDGPGRVGF